MNKFWTRVFIIAAAALFLLFFSNDFGLINIQQTTIVTAIGIDRSQEEGKIDVSAQIAVPNESKASSVLVQGVETVGEAIAEFNGKTGWYPTLVHCRLVLLGAEAVSEDVFATLDYFLRSEFVEDSCLVAVCETTAAETLQANSPVGDLPSSAITKVLSSQAQKTGQVSVCNLRDFSKGYFSESASGYLPIISIKKEASNEGGNQSSGSTQNTGSDSGSGQNGGDAGAQKKNDSDVFDASKTALFFQGKQVAELSPNETLAFNLADTKTDFAYGDVEVFENGTKVTYNLKMKIEKKAQKLGMTFYWYSPTPYCIYNPISSGLGNKSCAAFDSLISVAPNGDVLPCSSWDESMGNLFNQDFKTIWFSARGDYFRNKHFAPSECSGCQAFIPCQGACPLYWKVKSSTVLNSCKKEVEK